eukprot:12724-Heterococcus_DN1.PRE.5
MDVYATSELRRLLTRVTLVMGDTLLHLSRAAFEDYAAYITQCAAARVVIVSPANVRVTRPTPKTGSQTGSAAAAAVQSPPLFKVALQKSAAPVGAGTYVFEYDSPPEAFVAAVLATFDAAVQALCQSASNAAANIKTTTAAIMLLLLLLSLLLLLLLLLL